MEQLLGLVVAALRRADEPERHRGRRLRRAVVRADRLARGEGEALRLVDAAVEEQELGEAPLALAERRAVLEGSQDADRLEKEPLRAGDVALCPGAPGREVEGPSERPSGTCLGEVLPR